MTRDDILQHFKQDASTLLWCVEQLSLLQNLDATLTTKEEGVTYTPWNVAPFNGATAGHSSPLSHGSMLIGRGIYLWATLQYLQDTGASSKDLQYFIDHLQAGEWGSGCCPRYPRSAGYLVRTSSIDAPRALLDSSG